MALQLREGAAILDSDVDEEEDEKTNYFKFDDDDDDEEEEEEDDDDNEEEKEEIKSYEDIGDDDDDDDDDDDGNLSYGDDGGLSERCKRHNGDVDDVFRNDPFVPASVSGSSVVNHNWFEGDGNSMSSFRNFMEGGYSNNQHEHLTEEKEGMTINKDVSENHTGHDSSDSYRENDKPKEISTNDKQTRLERQRIVENYILGTTSQAHIDESANIIEDSLAPSISPPHSPPPVMPKIKTATTPTSGSADEFDEHWQNYLISTGSPDSENENETLRDPTFSNTDKNSFRSSALNSEILLREEGINTGERLLSTISATTTPDHQDQAKRLQPSLSVFNPQPTASPANPLDDMPSNHPLPVERSLPSSVVFKNSREHTTPIEPRTSHEQLSTHHSIVSHESPSLSRESPTKYPSTYSTESLSSNPLEFTVSDRRNERPSTPQHSSRESPSKSTVALSNNLKYKAPLTLENTASELPVFFAHSSTNLAEAEQTARESLRDIEVADTNRIKRLTLQVKVNLLKEQTKGLKCAFLIDEVFGTGEETRQPSQACLTLLRDTIATELTAASFSRYANVVDMITAENFRMENSTLEALQHDQIMSNPLFSEIYTGHQRGRTGKKTASINIPLISHNSSIDTEGPHEESNVHVSSRLTRSMILKQEFREVLMNAQAMSPSERLNRRHSYLRSLLDYKVTPLASWSKFLRILKNIISQIINGLYGEEVQASWDSTEPRPWIFGVTTSDVLGKQHVGAIGTTMVIGTIKSMTDRGIINISKNIGEIAIMLGVPVAMLPWNMVFASSPEYRDILTRSLSRVAKDTTVPSMFVLNQILSDVVIDKNGTMDDQHIPIGSNLSTEADRRETARRIFKDISIGESSGKYSIEETRRAALDAISDSRPVDSSTVALVNNRLLSDTIESVIDDKVPILENVLNSFLTYLDDNTPIINMLVLKLLRKAKVMNKLYNLKKTIEEEEHDVGKVDGNSNGEEKYENSAERGKRSLKSMLKGSKRQRFQ
nr:MAG: wsv313-like protein [Penaeus semisulcatus pemonivirus]